MEEVTISPNIKKVEGDVNDNHIEGVVFIDRENQKLMIPKGYYINGRYSFCLKEGEQIIGVHGTRDKQDYFSSLGFVVWVPPKF
jgi:hypothetical protein